MDNEKQAYAYLQWMNLNYYKQKYKLMAFCADKNLKWDEDIFCDTYLKIFEKIKKYGIKDDTESGFDNYTFMSFKTNVIREGQYARNQKRDGNVINLQNENEKYQNSKLTEQEKLKSDLYKDFATLYLLKQVEANFDSEHFYLFRLKTFTNMTYRQLAEHTGLKGVRQKVVDAKNWLKHNVKQDDIRKEFDDIYGEIL